MTSLTSIWLVVVLFVVVIGGIYIGVFTPTEGAAIGAFGTFLLLLVKTRFDRQGFVKSIRQAGEITSMVFLILIGATIFGYFLATSNLPYKLANFVAGMQVNRYVIFGGILLVYLFLGCIMDAMAMIILTIPIFFPLVMSLGFDPIWFGIIMVRVVEIAEITPPVGLNLYVLKATAKDVSMGDIIRGVVPFFIGDLCLLALLVAVPQISLFLPNLGG